MAKVSHVMHKKPIIGSHYVPYRETGMRGSGLYLWWAFCMIIMKNKILFKSLLGITIIVILSTTSYFGVNQYHAYQIEKIEREEIVDAQQKALSQAQEEIEKLKTQNIDTQNKQNVLEQKINSEQKSKTQDISISPAELDLYLSGVVELNCFGKEPKSGSASLWNLGGQIGYVVLTNYHVISGADGCYVSVQDTSTNTNQSGKYQVDKSSTFSWNSFTDTSVLKIVSLAGWEKISTPISNLNYMISFLHKCPVKMQLGSPVVIIGFPAFSQKEVLVNGHISSQSSRTITNGIISAHDTSLQQPIGSLPYPNYYISAKIDSGNSGGVAFSKDKNGLCVLGLPTWLTVGNFETQGIVQNIHNVMFKE